jgi:pimeloyl-ACP methyl ester carboxylesterase
VRYGPHAEQVIDVSGDGDGPTVALLHGGCWRARYRRELEAAVAADLAGHGYRVANVEYRRLDAGGTWPEPLDDVLTALGAVQAQLVVGHSAGGHLALLASAVLGLPAVAQAPVADLRRAVELGVCAGAAERLLAAGSPSPADAPPEVEHLVVHGIDDAHVPVEIGRAYAAVATACTYVELAGCGHMEHLDPASGAWQVACEWVSARLPPGRGSRTAGSPRS